MIKLGVISPSDVILSEEEFITSTKRREMKFHQYGFEIILNGSECIQNTVGAKVNQLHNAFLRKDIDGIICYTGGYNANEILPYLDFELIKEHRKPFVGYSDISVLLNAIRKKTKRITFHGPTYDELCYGDEYIDDYTMISLKKAFSEPSYTVISSERYQDQRSALTEKRNSEIIQNNGRYLIAEGSAQGVVIGGNISTLGLLQGTEFFPVVEQSVILFLEDDDLRGKYAYQEFERNLESLTQLPIFKQVRGMVFGRFQLACATQFTGESIKDLVEKRPQLKNMPIIGNVDFGHTQPNFTFPIGGMCQIDTRAKTIKFVTQQNE